jgi:DNA-binding GntR family transcriptional regulator
MSSPQHVGKRAPSAQDITYGWLKNHISGLSRDGGVFLSESEVAAQAGTSRTPVREALLRLEAEGFLTIVPKKGAYIPPISDSEIEAVMQARALVENWCVQRIVPVGAAFIAELETNIAEQKTLIDDPAGFIECDRAFHRMMVRQAGNPVLAEFYESLRERQIRMGIRAVASGENRARAVLEEHNAIVRALAEGDATAALEAHLAGTLAVLQLPVHNGHGEWSVRGLS